MPPSQPENRPALMSPFVILSVITRNWNLFRQMLRREIDNRTRDSWFGFAWMILSPLLMMALYVVVFGILFKGRFQSGTGESSIQYAIGVYIGLTVVGFFNETTGMAPFGIISNRNLVKKVVFPLEILPLSLTLSHALKFFINFCLILILLIFLTGTASLHWLWLPVICTPIIILTASVAWAIAAIGVYARDIQHLTPFFTQIIFWTSGVFYSAELVQPYPLIWNLLKWNPIFIANEQIRAVLLWSTPPDLSQLLYLFITAFVSLFIGSAVFLKLKSSFADYL